MKSKSTRPSACQRCGIERKWLQKHHVIPRSKGGTNEISNIEWICANCHEDVHGGPHGGRLAHEGEAIEKQRAANTRNWRDPETRVKRLLALANARRDGVKASKSRREAWVAGKYDGIDYKSAQRRKVTVPRQLLKTRYLKSMQCLARAERVTPGASQTMSKAPARFPIGVFPLFAEGGQGSRMRCVDGHEYIDWICALGAVTLGYNFEPVTAAVSEVCARGVGFGVPSHLEKVVAEKLIECMPAAEAVRFTKTGTEACMAAVRIARRSTGRDVVVTTKGSYHGWADWYVASREEHEGVPESLSDLIRVCEYNDLVSLRSALDDRVACVIMEPTLMTTPEVGYLGAVARLARANGSLVIWDEMILGYRLALGGGSEYYHVIPDLATYGKGMGNGQSISCVVGRADVMEEASVISGTFLGDAACLAAALVVIDTYRSLPVIERLHLVGRQLQQAYNEMAKGLQLPTHCDGPCWHPSIVWDGEQKNLAMSLFLQETARRGVLFHPVGLNTSYAMSEDDVRKTIDACWATLRVMQRGDWKKLFKGKEIQTLSWRRREAMNVLGGCAT